MLCFLYASTVLRASMWDRYYYPRWTRRKLRHREWSDMCKDTQLIIAGTQAGWLPACNYAALSSLLPSLYVAFFFFKFTKCFHSICSSRLGIEYRCVQSVFVSMYVQTLDHGVVCSCWPYLSFVHWVKNPLGIFRSVEFIKFMFLL